MGDCFDKNLMLNGDETWRGESVLWSNIYSFVKSMSLRCAVRLHIPEIIHSNGRPTTLNELISAVPIPAAKADAFRRLLRLLTDSGIFAVDQDNAYTLTPASRLLLPSPGGTSLAAIPLLSFEPGIADTWNHWDEWYKLDGPMMPFEVAHGVNTWEYLEGKPRLRGLFHDAMAADCHLLMDEVVNKCGGVFSGLRSVVDAGGGVGVAAKIIAAAFPEIEVTVLDLPDVVASLSKEKDDSPVKFVGGDIFQSIPNADAVFLKSVLHDWTDEKCVEILKKCKEAIPSKEGGGKVIIVDMVIDPQCEDPMARATQFACDIHILVASMGKEREEEDWEKIFKDAGFSDHKFTPALGSRYVIELYP